MPSSGERSSRRKAKQGSTRQPRTRKTARRDVEAYEAWRGDLAGRLSEAQITALERGWVVGEIAARRATPSPRDVEDARRRWMLGVLEIDVELKPAARAVLRRPGSTYRIEIFWQTTQKTIRRGPSRYEPKMVYVVGNPKIGLEPPPDLNQYFTAFFLHISETPTPHLFRRAPLAWPAPGQAVNLDYYQRLLDAYDALLAEGERRPAMELARRWGVEHSTMRARLSRGRKYLDRQGRGTS